MGLKSVVVALSILALAILYTQAAPTDYLAGPPRTLEGDTNVNPSERGSSLRRRSSAHRRKAYQEPQTTTNERFYRDYHNGTIEFKTSLSNGHVQYQRISDKVVDGRTIQVYEGYMSQRYADGRYGTSFYVADENGYRRTHVEVADSPPSLPSSGPEQEDQSRSNGAAGSIESNLVEDDKINSIEQSPREDNDSKSNQDSRENLGRQTSTESGLSKSEEGELPVSSTTTESHNGSSTEETELPSKDENTSRAQEEPLSPTTESVIEEQTSRTEEREQTVSSTTTESQSASSTEETESPLANESTSRAQEEPLSPTTESVIEEQTSTTEERELTVSSTTTESQSASSTEETESPSTNESTSRAQEEPLSPTTESVIEQQTSRTEEREHTVSSTTTESQSASSTEETESPPTNESTSRGQEEPLSPTTESVIEQQTSSTEQPILPSTEQNTETTTDPTSFTEDEYLTRIITELIATEKPNDEEVLEEVQKSSHEDKEISTESPVQTVQESSPKSDEYLEGSGALPTTEESSAENQTTEASTNTLDESSGIAASEENLPKSSTEASIDTPAHEDDISSHLTANNDNEDLDIITAEPKEKSEVLTVTPSSSTSEEILTKNIDEEAAGPTTELATQDDSVQSEKSTELPEPKEVGEDEDLTKSSETPTTEQNLQGSTQVTEVYNELPASDAIPVHEEKDAESSTKYSDKSVEDDVSDSEKTTEAPAPIETDKTTLLLSEGSTELPALSPDALNDKTTDATAAASEEPESRYDISTELPAQTNEEPNLQSSTESSSAPLGQGTLANDAEDNELQNELNHKLPTEATQVAEEKNAGSSTESLSQSAHEEILTMTTENDVLPTESKTELPTLDVSQDNGDASTESSSLPLTEEPLVKKAEDDELQRDLKTTLPAEVTKAEEKNLDASTESLPQSAHEDLDDSQEKEPLTKNAEDNEVQSDLRTKLPEEVTQTTEGKDFDASTEALPATVSEEISTKTTENEAKIELPTLDVNQEEEQSNHEASTQLPATEDDLLQKESKTEAPALEMNIENEGKNLEASSRQSAENDDFVTSTELPAISVVQKLSTQSVEDNEIPSDSKTVLPASNEAPSTSADKDQTGSLFSNLNATQVHTNADGDLLALENSSAKSSGDNVSTEIKLSSDSGESATTSIAESESSTQQPALSSSEKGSNSVYAPEDEGSETNEYIFVQPIYE